MAIPRATSQTAILAPTVQSKPPAKASRGVRYIEVTDSVDFTFASAQGAPVRFRVTVLPTKDARQRLSRPRMDVVQEQHAFALLLQAGDGAVDDLLGRDVTEPVVGADVGGEYDGLRGKSAGAGGPEEVA